MNIKLIIKIPPRVSEAVCFRSLPLSVPSDNQLIMGDQSHKSTRFQRDENIHHNPNKNEHKTRNTKRYKVA